MANTINGIGTSYLGRGRYEQDGSFVTTKWFVLGFFPLIPLGSARVLYEGTTGIPFISRSSAFELVEELPTDWAQVVKIWCYSVFIIAWTGWLLNSSSPPAAKIIGATAGVLLPHALRWLARKRVGAD